MPNLIIYDALSITSKIHGVSEFMELLGLRTVPWINANGSHGFQYRMYYECISIHYGRDDDVVWLEMMGQGCRAFETYGNGNYEALFNLVLANKENMNITRLDVAYDDKSGLLDIHQLCEDTRNQEYISRFSEWQIIQGSKGDSITHGSMKSEMFLRIYDKAAERGLTDGSHWVRVEIQLRRDRALQFILSSQYEIGERFAGVLVNYIRYIEPCDDSNKWRWPLKKYWADLIEDSAAISIYQKPGTEYNIFHMDNFVFNQSGNAIQAELEILGIDNFISRLKERSTRPNPKYQEIVKKAKKGLI